MTEPWEMFEQRIAKLNNALSKRRKEVNDLQEKLDKVEEQYIKWQEQSNRSEPCDA